MNKPRIIIGLSGLAGAGKDTAADFLVAHHGFTKMAFGDALKEELAEAFNVPVDFFNNRDSKETDCEELALINCRNQNFNDVQAHLLRQRPALAFESRSPRWIMQQWGTEYRRKYYSQDYWTTQLAKRIESTVGNVVVTDVRFDDEADFISRLDGHIWQINRRNIAPVNSHSSERGIAPYFIDQNINNYGDIHSLHIICELHLQSAIQHQSRCLWGHA
ncbi:hypothetical protein R6242_14200 [Iodobacter sp. CM08]|uniref:deoxynucleotide monophosphate kinase family protein n=1 Tax=Iodobacter sp. CM08 TaxID=3085902 RepID=UPI00298248C4|nr:hypothetical protein [Iodobacter sp. CM08]MDW5417718.1 hypothetical protein [Iodobacter sp. CM08]